MYDDDDFAGVCRDEFCELDYVHPSHVSSLTAPKAGQPQKPWWLKRGDARLQDPLGLTEALQSLFRSTDFPLAFRDISQEVEDTYGSVSPRTLHRQVQRLVGTGFVLRLDVQLTFKAYIRHDSRLAKDIDGVRENMVTRYVAEDGPWCRQRPAALRARRVIAHE